MACGGGGSGKILTSTNGKDWSHRNETQPTTGLSAVAYGAGQYVAAGYDGVVTHSSDASSWSSQYIPGGIQWDDLLFGGGQFVAVGWPGAIATSADGINWVKRN